MKIYFTKFFYNLDEVWGPDIKADSWAEAQRIVSAKEGWRVVGVFVRRAA